MPETSQYPEVMAVPDAAKFLGKTPSALRWLARHGKVPGRKVGRGWMFSRAALLDWVSRGPAAVPAKDETR